MSRVHARSTRRRSAFWRLTPSFPCHLDPSEVLLTRGGRKSTKNESFLALDRNEPLFLAFGDHGGHRSGQREELGPFRERQSALGVRVRGESAQGGFQHAAVQPKPVAEHRASGMEHRDFVTCLRKKKQS